jgi:IS5 family transposase
METNPPPGGGGGFADYAFVSLHCPQNYFDASYRISIDPLKDMSQITGEIGLNAVGLRPTSMLCNLFDWISVSVCRMLLRQSAQVHDSSNHVAVDDMSYERPAASRHYC